MVINHWPSAIARKELISNIAQDKTVWLDGINAAMLALVYLSPAIPSCTDVHINVSGENAEFLDKLKTTLESKPYQDWDTSLTVHHLSNGDVTSLNREMPDQLDMAAITGVSLSQAYLEAMLAKLKVGGVLWIDSSTMAGRTISDPNLPSSRMNDWIAAQTNLEVAMGIDSVSYTLIRKVS
jgi:hypothetical protein